MELTHRTRGVRRTAALVVATAAAALAIPAAANAAVTGAVTGDTATLTGDGANDNIAITVSGANLRHNLPTGAGTFASNIDFDSATGGEQTLTAAAGRLTIDGGAGDDIIVGGPNLDTLRGGDGDDRLTGGPNNAAKPTKESISGGAGNDVMLWFNGDGDDTNDGGDGVDETQFNNGTADDVMSLAPLGGGAHRFNRVGAAIEIDIAASTERLNVNAFSGADSFTAAAGTTLPTTIDAGPGNDTITTGDGADLVQGGTGVDTLNGGAGGDRIVGNPGNDVENGGPGDDTIVWNNGDANDTINGNDGLDKVENNLGAADDVSALSVLNGKVHYARTNAPFTLDVASTEVFELNTFGGNDTLITGPGLGALIAVVADAGSGNDTFTGGDESTTYFGGLGDDTLDPGPGIGDMVDGQDGNDNLKVRDTAADLARGGTGTDSATADFEDVLVDVENKDVTAGPPAPDTKGTAIRLRTRRVTSKLKKGVYKAKLRVECPAAELGGCRSGILALQTARKVNLGGTRVRALVAVKKIAQLDPGERRRVTVTLPKGVRALSRKGTLSLVAITTNRDAAGNLAQRSSRLSIKLVR
jgi:Ca2+-binding RTX toxin-like protein